MTGQRTPSPQDVFAVGRGQYENIGDVLLRRPLLTWARESGRLHVYVGHSPPGYDEGLGLRPDDVVYRSFLSWYGALLRSAARGRASSIYKPGELQLTIVGMKEHLAMLPAAALVRARGGAVARVGAGARNFAPLPRALMWPSNALSSYTRWRDDRTAAYLGFGPAMPDLGFVGGMSDADLASAIDDGDARDILVVSLRDDTEVAPRPYPGPAWFDGVKQAATRLGLRIAVVTQITVDDAKSTRLAADLGADEVIGWPVLDDHGPQEERLRALYRRTAVVVSDRLHVVIAAYTEGAAPVGLLMDDDDKIARHFETVGIRGLALNASRASAGEIADHIVARAAERTAALRRLVEIRRRLDEVRADLRSVLARRPSGRGRRSVASAHTPPVAERDRVNVYHVGRAGDIPGGMTQVINAYLRWPFDQADMSVIVSRADPGDHVAALRCLLSARREVTRIARRQPHAVIVVHLSERGSFLREGHIARHAARLGLPVIAHLHGSEFAAYEKAHPRTVGNVLSACSHVVTLSDESTTIAARHIGSERVSLIPNAIPKGVVAEKRPTIVFGGVVSHRKGIDVLQRAWRDVSDEFPDWTLEIAGPVRDADLVDASLARARFLGALPHDELMTLLSRAEIAVLPSRDEAMPMFLLEAMARRACVIATRVGGVPDLLADGGGVLIEPDDHSALSEALRTVLRDERARRAIAETGHETFQRTYAAHTVYPRLEAVWTAPLGVV